jgi:hypothetical protein
MTASTAPPHPPTASLLTPSSTTVHSSGGAVAEALPFPSHRRPLPHLAVASIHSSPSPSRQSAAPRRRCAPRPSHAIAPLSVGTSLAACGHVDWAQTYPVVGLLWPNTYGPSIRFIRICFLRILHGYVLTEYPVWMRIQIRYVSVRRVL